MAFATGIGSWPGTSLERACEEIASVLGRVPFLPELPRRGTKAGMIQRTLGAVYGDAAGDLLAADLAAWAPWAGDGPVTISLVGPWTLARCTGQDPAELAPRLADAAGHLVRATEAATGAAVTLQLDEPLLPVAPEPRLAAYWGAVKDRIGDRDVVVHSCALPVPVAVLSASGLPAAVDCAGLGEFPDGWRAGIVPTTGPFDADVLVGILRRLIPACRRGDLVVTPTCGLGFSDDAVARLAATAQVARRLPDAC